ncbi:hypothetical protein ACS6YE_09765 [Streptococcus suis]
MTWNFDTMKEALSEMEKVDYQEFIKAFLSLELSISDYSLLSLETLQAMIQQDLAISSQDYFGDLVHLALQKDLLDQKSHFLQHYVATVMESIPQESDQRALVLD